MKLSINESKQISNGVYLYDGEFIKVASDRQNMVELIIEPGVEKIGSYAFAGCEKLRKVTIPDSLKEIGYDAFFGCKNVTVYTDNEYAKKLCSEHYHFKVLPLNKTTTPDSNNNDAYIKIGKAIVKYYEEVIYGSDTIHIQCTNRNDTKAMYREITDALKSIENT